MTSRHAPVKFQSTREDKSKRNEEFNPGQDNIDLFFLNFLAKDNYGIPRKATTDSQKKTLENGKKVSWFKTSELDGQHGSSESSMLPLRRPPRPDVSLPST